MKPHLKSLFSNWGTSLLLLGAIFAGSLIGWLSPATGSRMGGWTDPTILLLVGVLFFEVRFEQIFRVKGHLQFLSVAWVANFIIIPTLGFAIASVFLAGQPLFFTGLLIYFMAPCTDWFLGFTRLANGNTALGAVLLPVNMISQLLLYPVYLALFASKNAGLEAPFVADALLRWFLIPFIIAIALHYLLRAVTPATAFERLLGWTGRIAPIIIALLVVFIFAANIGTIFTHVWVFLIILAAVFVFFVSTYFLGEGLAIAFKLNQPDRVLLTMTTAARNAPLMLGVTAAVFPDQPLVYAALIIGMLVEFPHLTLLKHLLLRKDQAVPAASTLNPIV